ncbi:uncharacterized protein LOC143302279 isoform X2 [Babylonia areolata]|uniref:uncharacterized protein LOC143302279 isoform X2 n=1 Tax=Babylonia areolata TaxID=304850 RepID=UPI003FD18845
MATQMAANTTYRGDRRPVQQNRHGGRNSFNAPRQNMRRTPNLQHHQSQPIHQAQAMPPPPDKNFYKSERCVRALMNMIGCVVELVTSNQAEYVGILAAVSPGMDVELKEARNTKTPDGKPGSRNQVDSLLIRACHIACCTARNLDMNRANSAPRGEKSEFLTDTAISGTNGTEREIRFKNLVHWSEGDDPALALATANVALESMDGSGGWAAEEMFRTNKERYDVKSSYSDSLEQYTTPMPRFKTKEEQQAAEARAAQAAREIENSEGYRSRMGAENSTENDDEESKYSAVVRSQSASQPETGSSRQPYVPPGRRQQEGHSAQLNQRGAAPGLNPHGPPLPQRERRADRDRGDRRQEDHRGGGGGGERDKMLAPSMRNPHAVPSSQQSQQGPPPAAPQPSKETMERLSAGEDRKPEGPGLEAGYPHPPRPNHQEGPPPPPHHSMHQPPHPVSQGPAPGPQNSSLPLALPNHHGSYSNHGPPSSVSGPPPPAAASGSSLPPQGPPSHLPPSSLPPLAQIQASRSNPPPPPPSHVTSASVVPHTFPTEAREGPPPSVPSTCQQQQHQPTAPTAAPANMTTLVGDKKSPRAERERQEQQVARLKEFKNKFVVTLAEDGAPQKDSERPQEKKENEERGQGGSGPTAVSSPTQGASITAVSTQGSSSHPTSTSQGTTASDSVTRTSTLNPFALEFKPRQQQQPQPQPTSVLQQISSPAPSGTPPSQGPRQSPGIMSQQPLMPYNHHGFLQHKMVPVPNQSQTQAKAAFPKRAVVSVDPVQLAHSATGQPLTLGAQAATMQQPGFVFGPGTVLPSTVIQQQYHPVHQMRVMQQLPQGAGMDPALGATGQQPHPVAQPFIMAQQPMPAHMPAAQALTQGVPQPAHTMHQHMSQHTMPPHQSNMPPASQNNPLPAGSPVPHLGGNGHSHGPPQINHTQGAPPTSNTPQSMMFQHQMPGILPPQGAAGHAMPAHTAQGPTQTLQFLHPGGPHQLPGVSFTQSGATGASGPAPAHVQQSGHVNQTHHVVVMPHPPAQAINQAPMNNQPHQQHQQHATAAAQFQQQLQGANNQLHGPVGPNQHLLQGNVPAAGSGMGMHHMHHYLQPGTVQGSHTHHHNHSGAHGHGHTHTHSHFQGQ